MNQNQSERLEVLKTAMTNQAVAGELERKIVWRAVGVLQHRFETKGPKATERDRQAAWLLEFIESAVNEKG